MWTMGTIDRRRFLTSTIAGLTASSLLHLPKSSAKESDYTTANPLFDAGDYDPTTLFLTWQRDPTTTITIQWIGPSSGTDTAIAFKPFGDGGFQRSATATKPYPNTDLEVHRCELTG